MLLFEPRVGHPVKEGLRPRAGYTIDLLLSPRVGHPVKEGLRQHSLSKGLHGIVSPEWVIQ